MKRKIVWLVVSGLMVLALLAASCAPKVEEAAPSAEKPVAPAEAVAPVVAEKPAAPTGPEMVKVSLKKLDGTVVEKLVEKPKYGGTLTVVRTSSIRGWDPFYGSVATIDSTLDPTHDDLLIGDWARGPAGTGEAGWQQTTYNMKLAKGALAESWEIVPPDTIIFHIRQGVHFGLNPALEASRLVGGREVTADDIVWNIRRLTFESKLSGLYSSAGVSRALDAYATDKWTAVVKAPEETIWDTFQYMADWFSTFPPEVAKKYGDFNDWTRVVGTGPFMMKDYVAMNSVTWARNPNYWEKDPFFPENQLPYVDTLKMLIIPDASTRMSALRTGKIDLDDTNTILWEDAASLQKTSPQLKYIKKRSGSTWVPSGRIDKPELPFKDINVRRALMMAINHQEMVDTYYGGEAVIYDFPFMRMPETASIYIPLEELGPAPDGFDTKKIYEYNPAEAKQLLAAAGYPNGFKTEIILTPDMVDIASILKEYWAKNLNVDLKFDVKETNVHATITTAKTWKEMNFNGHGTMAVTYTHSIVRSGHGRNYAMVSNPIVEANYARLAALEPWTDAWLKAWQASLLYIAHQVYYYSLPRYNVWTFYQPWLKRFNGESAIGMGNGLSYQYNWIDQELKKAMGR